MGALLFLLAGLVGLSAWTASMEDALDAELSRDYCEECGAEILEDDECCIICGAKSAKRNEVVS